MIDGRILEEKIRVNILVRSVRKEKKVKNYFLVSFEGIVEGVRTSDAFIKIVKD